MILKRQHTGVIIAAIIIALWIICLCAFLHYPLSFFHPLPYLFLLIQTHLYTGLFITAHDAMHGTVSTNKKINRIIGSVSALLYAYNWFPFLLKKHQLHHKHPVTHQDPDYHEGNFLFWYFRFLKEYLKVWQIVLMALTYNFLLFFFPERNIVLFWMVPSLLSTLQLFYFGTYLPHRNMEMSNEKHRARSQSRNHVLAFLSCYFFGYHYEHHAHPYVPWWKLHNYR